MQNGKPNIIFIMADQLAAKSIGCYGSGVDSTPTLDALAARGLRFDRCYATSPVCAPNRACFLSGRSPVVNGIISNNYILSTDSPTYAHVLQAGGYRTAQFGKFHVTPMHCPAPKSMAYLGFDESINSDDTKWGWYEWVEKNHPEWADKALAMCWPGWPEHNPLAAKCREMAAKYIVPARAASEWHLMYPSILPPEVHDTTFITEIGLDFMTRHLDNHSGQPFFCHFSYVDPHDPYDPPEPYASMFDPDDMPDPAPAAWLDHHPIPELEASLGDLGIDKLFAQGPAAVRKLRALYHGSLKYMDDQIARILEFVRARGIEEDTRIVFTTDHGEMLGDHRMITKGVKHYDMGIRCPLIVAGESTPIGVTGRLTCTLDFYPTFCELAGIPIDQRPPLEGRSFAPVANGAADPHPWTAVSVAYGLVESVITDDRWRLTRYLESGRMQMFNLTDDPREQHDLIDDPAFADRKIELLGKLIEVMANPRQVMNYANLPVIDGRKIPVERDRFLDPIPYFPHDTPPYLG